MPNDNNLWIMTEVEEVEATVEVEGRRSGTDRGGGFGAPETVETTRMVTRRKRVSLDAQALKTQMESMLAIVNDLFSQADASTGLRLDEVELLDRPRGGRDLVDRLAVGTRKRRCSS